MTSHDCIDFGLIFFWCELLIFEAIFFTYEIDAAKAMIAVDAII